MFVNVAEQKIPKYAFTCELIELITGKFSCFFFHLHLTPVHPMHDLAHLKEQTKHIIDSWFLIATSAMKMNVPRSHK